MTTRRDFLKSSGMLVVGFSAMSIAPASAFDEAMVQATGQGPGMLFTDASSTLMSVAPATGGRTFRA
jgi:hypothetical protein